VTHPLPPLVAERLRALRERPVEVTEKGCGAASAGRSAAELAATRPPLHAAGFTYPLLTLRESALAGNIAAMAAYCAHAGVALAPHGKTAMSPELAARQLAHGAWGITVATIGQLRTYRTFGFPRLLLANELVDQAGIGWLAAELAADPGLQAYCYVDSAEGVAILDGVLTRCPAGRRLPVLVELGFPGGRTGCRTDSGALAVARAAAATGTLRLAGVAGYEGGIGGRTGQTGSQARTLELVASFCRRLRALADTLQAHAPGGEEFIVTAGGSAFFDVVARELTAGGSNGPDGGTAGPAGARDGITAILRSGAYLTHDHGLYAAVSPAARGSVPAPELRPALELWAQVLSRPEPGLALLGAGRRDVGFDSGLPVPLRAVRRDGRLGPGGSGLSGSELSGSELSGSELSGSELFVLNDQHGYLRLRPDSDLAPGDLVGLGISHPCTTLDKWRVIPVVNDDDQVTDMVHAFF
jgi:D-serine dehydratase